MRLDDVQIRLVILYALKHFKISASVENLQEILVWQDIIDYFTMVDFLLDMEKLGMVTTVTVENVVRYDITEKGDKTVSMFKNKIPMSLRDKIYFKCDEMVSDMAKGRSIAADIVPIDDRNFMAKCGIYEFNTPLMEINIYAGTREQAEAIAERFKTQSSSLYKTILEKIIED